MCFFWHDSDINGSDAVPVFYGRTTIALVAMQCVFLWQDNVSVVAMQFVFCVFWQDSDINGSDAVRVFLWQDKHSACCDAMRVFNGKTTISIVAMQ